MGFFRKTVWACFIIFLLTACRGREVVIPLVFEGEKLVLWGRLEAGKPVRIQVMRTFPAVGPLPEETTINTATVTLFKNGDFYTQLASTGKDGFYGSDRSIEAGQTYTVRVEAEGYPTAESEEVTVPVSVPEFRYTWKRDADPERNSGSGPQDYIAFYFKANERLPDTYLTMAFRASFSDNALSAYSYPAATNLVANEEECHTSGISFDREFAYQFMMNGACIPADAPLGFFVSSSKLDSRPGFGREYIRAHTLTLQMAAVTKEWFRYNQIEEKQPEGLDHLVLPPQEAYTNVKNGYGIIYGYNAILTTIM